MYRFELRETGEEESLKYAIVGIIAVLIAGVFVLAAVPMGSSGKAVGFDSNSRNAPTNEPKRHASGNEAHDWENETDDVDEVDVNGTLLAGGGGWHAVNMSGTICKDTFGVFIDGDSGNWSMSSLVFQARDQGAMVHAINFTKVVFDNTTVANITYVHAWGWATYDKREGFWFHLVLMDNGTRTNDLVDLALYKDTDQNWTMDETSPLLHWVFNGLGGGNIWVGAQDLVSDYESD
jgi:hypothetical protein